MEVPVFLKHCGYQILIFSPHDLSRLPLTVFQGMHFIGTFVDRNLQFLFGSENFSFFEYYNDFFFFPLCEFFE